MSNPGVWMLGSTDKTERESGLALAIEYAGNTGTTTWVDPASPTWDYLRFGKPASTTIKADEVLMMIFGKKPGGAKGGMDLWMINGKSWPEIDPIKITRGKRYRLSMMNASQCVHPVHLHRHVFEVMSLNGKASSGILKDTLNLDPFGRAEVDFVANNPGPSLFHCHHQLHMDYGFMQLIQYV
jgi:FtsP/CotA-like multicopper oxidase with cupredoxin domain